MINTNSIRRRYNDAEFCKARVKCEYMELADDAMRLSDEIDALRVKVAELEAENAKMRKLIGEIPEGDKCGKCQRLVFPFIEIICELTGDNLDGQDIRAADLDNVHKCAACLAAFPNGNKGE